MRGVFGRWDWVTNGVLFTLKHIYQRWLYPAFCWAVSVLPSPPGRWAACPWRWYIIGSAISFSPWFSSSWLCLRMESKYPHPGCRPANTAMQPVCVRRGIIIDNRRIWGSAPGGGYGQKSIFRSRRKGQEFKRLVSSEGDRI